MTLAMLPLAAVACSSPSGNAQACAAFWKSRHSESNGNDVLHAYHWATTQPLIGGLDKLSRDIITSEAQGTQYSAQTVLDDADNVAADCNAAGYGG